jgi:S-adenosylmethionine:tRNA ribosyltransferase-isomerase
MTGAPMGPAPATLGDVRTDDFAYDLPEDLIAQTPIEPRDAARLLVLRRATHTLAHRVFRDIADELCPGDLLVVNDTRVLRARLHGALVGSGGRVEALLLRDLGGGDWETLVRPARRLRPGRRVVFGTGAAAVEATVVEARADGTRVLRFPSEARPETLGEVPLPPYIHTPLAEPERYQTVYARAPGSAAAPTAGLHFTPELLARLAARGIATATVTLHIGPGTFRPVTVADPRAHPMHAEFYRIDAAAAAAIAAARARGGRVVAVGTTVVRVLEQVGAEAGDGPPRPAEGWTRLLILPGHRFRLVDALITNFHLPRSTLLMLVCAFAGRDFVLHAYREAVVHRYRFYSFGDAMLIV